MIDPVDSILLDLFRSRIPALAGPSKVGFAPSNAGWKVAIVSSSEERVNFYLYDVRDANRRFGPETAVP